MNFASGQPSSFSSGAADYGTCLKDTLRYLIEEGRAGSPKMMSVGLHGRLARPGRVAVLQEFVDFAKSYGKEVWICTREQIADYWTENHYPMGKWMRRGHAIAVCGVMLCVSVLFLMQTDGLYVSSFVSFGLLTGAGSPVKDSTTDGETGVTTTTTVDGVTTEMADIDLSERSEGDSI
jgi:hypothetical protein